MEVPLSNVKTMNILIADTLSGVIDPLHQAAGYVDDFNLRPNCLYCASQRIEVEPDAFAVDAVYRATKA